MKLPELFSRTCPICGKEFFPSKDWAYRLNKSVKRSWLVCSYSCLLIAKKKTERPPKPQNERIGGKAVLMLAADGRIIEEYENATAAATKINGSAEGIRRCCRGKTPFYLGRLWRYKEGQKE